jgi:hypothetical protein
MGRYDYKYDHAADPMEPEPGQTIEHAIGDVIIGFEELDDAISFAISGILNRGDDMGRIVTSQLSFRNKVRYVWSPGQTRPARLNPREADR